MSRKRGINDAYDSLEAFSDSLSSRSAQELASLEVRFKTGLAAIRVMRKAKAKEEAAAAQENMDDNLLQQAPCSPATHTFISSQRQAVQYDSKDTEGVKGLPTQPAAGIATTLDALQLCTNRGQGKLRPMPPAKWQCSEMPSHNEAPGNKVDIINYSELINKPASYLSSVATTSLQQGSDPTMGSISSRDMGWASGSADYIVPLDDATAAAAGVPVWVPNVNIFAMGASAIASTGKGAVGVPSFVPMADNAFAGAGAVPLFAAPSVAAAFPFAGAADCLKRDIGMAPALIDSGAPSEPAYHAAGPGTECTISAAALGDDSAALPSDFFTARAVADGDTAALVKWLVAQAFADALADVA